ncbi:ABC transporter ATP-binding protein [Corynebacterium pseudotuberculosis]|uniref:ATP-binding cassette domain-containing protein n=1 Tax=Corynebacterium pseudotuberculosis TaxID=1719 RepID=UPI00065DCB6F|nr:ABC transporter ATP-binding protein [Corynebacterium pseudotuberculosis]AKP09608.1 ABC transporter ATP-binding protein [Corynebacterium pseudotuberculosis]
MTYQDTVIKCVQLKKSYGKHAVFAGLNFELQGERIHGLVGANAAGKTTLLRIIAGQIPHEGLMEIFGEPSFDNQKVMDRTVLVGIDAPLPQSWSPRKLFAFAACRYPRWDQKRCEELIEIFEIPLTKRYSSLSRGQKSAVGIVMAFAARCELTLLDEPYLGLDVYKRKAFYQELRHEQEQHPRTFILSTHHLNEAAGLFDELLILRNGAIADSGAVEDIAESVVELMGTTVAIDLALSELNVEVIMQKTVSGVTKALVRATHDEVARISELHGIRVQRVTLEQAVFTEVHDV